MGISSTKLFFGDTPIDTYYIGDVQVSAFPKTPPTASRSGLVFDVDATKVESYSGSGSIWYSIGGGPNLEPFTGSGFAYEFPTYDSTNKEFNFNGSDTIIIGSFTSSLSTNTMIWWVKNGELDPDSEQSGAGINYGNYIVGGAQAQWRAMNYDEGDTRQFRMVNTGGGGSIYSEAQSSNEKYDLVVAIRQTANYKLYLNGVLQGALSGSVPGTVFNGGTYLAGTRFINTGNNPISRFTGSMSRIAVYNRVLSENEINDLYEAGRFGG
jgi:hypothetical protein